MQHGVGDFFYRGTHRVGGVYCADNCGPALVATFVLYANALYVGNCDKVLPYLFSKAALIKLVAENGVCLAESFESITGNRAKTSYAKTGAGEGLTVNHSVRKAECLAYYSYLVLEEKL